LTPKLKLASSSEDEQKGRSRGGKCVDQWNLRELQARAKTENSDDPTWKSAASLNEGIIQKEEQLLSPCGRYA